MHTIETIHAQIDIVKAQQRHADEQVEQLVLSNSEFVKFRENAIASIHRDFFVLKHDDSYFGFVCAELERAETEMIFSQRFDKLSYAVEFLAEQYRQDFEGGDD